MIFSKRMGFVKVEDYIQKEFIADTTRVRLWNIYSITIYKDAFVDPVYSSFERSTADFYHFYISLRHVFFGEFIDDIVDTKCEIKHYIKGKFFDIEWFRVYDLLEFSFHYFNDQDFIDRLNTILIEDNCAYRIIDRLVTPITDDVEMESINTALAATDRYRAVYTHLHDALLKLSNRQAPDYRNSIKESISAVESVCNCLSGTRSSTFAKAIDNLDKDNIIHPALKRGFKSIYGFTSDEGGIRHFLTEECKELKFEDAYYFLVTCSSFVHYLIQKYGNRK